MYFYLGFLFYFREITKKFDGTLTRSQTNTQPAFHPCANTTRTNSPTMFVELSEKFYRKTQTRQKQKFVYYLLGINVLTITELELI